MTCTSCFDGAFVSAEMTCVCKPGYLKGTKGACVKCHKSCETCDILKPHVCLTCGEGFELNDDEKCTCKEGHLLDERKNECVACAWWFIVFLFFFVFVT